MHKTKEFEEIYRTYFRRIQSFCYYYLQDLDAAQNTAQDVFMVIWKKRDELDLNDDLKTYLFVLAKNKCFNLLKHNQIHLRYINTTQDIKRTQLNKEALQHSSIAYIYEKEIQDLLKETLNKMPERTKRIFLMSREEELTYKRIAEIEQVTTKTVEYHITSALRLLRTALKGYSTYSK